MTVDKDELTHDYHGKFGEVPSIEIDMSYNKWHIVEIALNRHGLGAAWEYDKEDSTLYLWGEDLDKENLYNLQRHISEIEEDYRRKNMLDNASQASMASGAISRVIEQKFK